MKILILYYSQTGNTQKVARQVRDGLRSQGNDVTLKFINHAEPQEVLDYDAVGLGTPVWYEMPPNVRKFVEEMPDLKGKPGFTFITHGTMPDLYFPLAVPRLSRKGLKMVDWNNWYGNCEIQIFPEPYYTHGHPDTQDLSEAYAWGASLHTKLAAVLAGDDSNLPPMPMPNMSPMHANAAIHHLGGFHNVHGRLVRDPEKCLYPKCHICMDNCTMGYIDLESNRYGNLGNTCDDCHGCTYCEMLCPVGAIRPATPYEEEAPVGHEHGSALFEMVLGKAEEEGKFRRLIPFTEVGTKTPYYSVHSKHPRLKALRFQED